MPTAAIADAFARGGAEALDAAIIATTPDGVVSFWSRGAQRLYGWRSSEAVGRTIVDLTPAAASRETAADIMEALAAGRAWQGAFPVRRRDGSSFQAYVVDTPVTTGGGGLAAIVGVSGPADSRAQVESANMLLWHTLRRNGDVFPVPEAAPSQAYAQATETPPAGAYYRCYLLGPDGRFVGVREGIFPRDVDALAYAEEAVRREPECRGAEVWQMGRQVGRVTAVQPPQ